METHVSEMRSIHTAVTRNVTDSHINDKWHFPEDVTPNHWYIGIYFGDRTPYLVKWDKHLWRNSAGSPMAVPMRIKGVGEFPKLSKEEKVSEENKCL